MKFDMSNLRQLPIWLLLFLLAAISIAVGASDQVTISGNSIHLLYPLNYVLVGLGVIFVATGIILLIIQLRKTGLELPIATLPVDSISVDVLLEGSGNHPRALVRGKVNPPVGGVRIWILREPLSQSPGKFHVGGESALTNKDGEWEQFTNLWKGGRFRIHAMIVGPDAESLFKYYRTAYEKAWQVFKSEVNPDPSLVPGWWPLLDSLPTRSVSAYSEVVV